MTFKEWWESKHAPHTKDIDPELVEIIKNFSRVAWEAAQQKWQPIETAPEREPVLAYFKELDDNYIAVAAREDGDWWTDTCGEFMEANTSPTHWMPLPDTPRSAINELERI